MTIEYLDPATRRRVERDLEDLRSEFAGVFSSETIKRYIAESVEDLSESRIQTFLPSSSTASSAPDCERSDRTKEPS